VLLLICCCHAVETLILILSQKERGVSCVSRYSQEIVQLLWTTTYKFAILASAESCYLRLRWKSEKRSRWLERWRNPKCSVLCAKETNDAICQK